jgi:hypothetical protein
MLKPSSALNQLVWWSVRVLDERTRFVGECRADVVADPQDGRQRAVHAVERRLGRAVWRVPGVGIVHARVRRRLMVAKPDAPPGPMALTLKL